MKRALVVILVAVLGAASGPLAQQPSASPTERTAAPHRPVDLERFKQSLTDTRRKMFAEAMSSLSAGQLQSFWAVYADYEKEKDAITSARTDLANKYVATFVAARGLADGDIAEIVNEMGTLQKRNTDLRLKYFGIYSGKIDVKTAGRFALVDDYVTTAMRLDLLDQIPFPGDEGTR